MTKSLDPFRFLLIAVSGGMNQQPWELLDYLREENRVLREPLGQKRRRCNDDQHRRWAAKAQGVGRKLLREVATIGTGGHRRHSASTRTSRRAPELLLPQGCLRITPNLDS